MRRGWVQFCSLAALPIFTAVFAAPVRAAVQETFDNTSDITNNFNVTGNAFTTAATTGAGNTGNAIVPGSDSTATYKASSFALGINQSITESVEIAQTTASSGSQVLIQLGFGNQNTNVFDNTGGDTNVSIFSRLYSLNNTQYELLSDNKSSYASGASETVGVSTITLNGTASSFPFYLYSVTLTRTDTSTFTATSTVSYVGTNENNAPTTIATYTLSGLSNGTLGTQAGNGLLYAGFRARSTGGAYQVDNFNVTDPVTAPEPASMAMFAAGVFFLTRRCRARGFNRPVDQNQQASDAGKTAALAWEDER